MKLAEGRIGITQEALEFTKGLKKSEVDGGDKKSMGSGRGYHYQKSKGDRERDTGNSSKGYGRGVLGDRGREEQCQGSKQGSLRRVTPEGVLKSPGSVTEPISIGKRGGVKLAEGRIGITQGGSGVYEGIEKV